MENRVPQQEGIPSLAARLEMPAAPRAAGVTQPVLVRCHAATGAGSRPVLAQVPSDNNSVPPVPASAWNKLPRCVC